MNALLAVLHIFFKPATSVHYQNQLGKKAWILPLLISSAVFIVLGILQLPIVLEVMRNHPGEGISIQQAKATADRYENIHKFAMVLAPLTVALGTMLETALLIRFAKLFDLRVAFSPMFSLLSHTNLVPYLAAIAQAVVVQRKGSVSSRKELEPAFGLDLLLADDANRFLMAGLNFLSLFTLWQIVVLAWGFAALAHTDKGQAFLVTSPFWLLGLVFALLEAALIP